MEVLNGFPGLYPNFIGGDGMDTLTDQPLDDVTNAYKATLEVRKFVSELSERYELYDVHHALLMSLYSFPFGVDDLDDLHLSRRVFNALRRQRITTIHQVVMVMDTDENVLLNVDGFGKHMLEELKCALNAYRGTASLNTEAAAHG